VSDQSSYKQLFQLTGAKRLIFFGFLGRAPYSMLQVGMVIFGNFKTDSYAIGGAMAAGFSISNAVAQPLNGRLVDKYGQKAVVFFLLTLFLISTSAISFFNFELNVIYVLLSILIGISVPNIGVYTRRNWKLITQKKDNQKVQAIESAIDELNFLVGPSVFAIISKLFNPVIALFIAVISSTVGTVGVVFYKNLQDKLNNNKRVFNKNKIWLTKEKILFLITLIFVGACLSSISVYIVAKEDIENLSNLTAIYYLLNGATALNVALAYGYIFKNKISLVNYNKTLLVLSLSVITYFLFNEISYLYLSAIFAGFGIGPIFLLANSYVSNTTEQDVLTEAFSWLGSSVGIGLAVGSTLFGYLIENYSLATAKYLFLAFPLCAILLIPMNKGWHNN
jgi:MFS family permease